MKLKVALAGLGAAARQIHLPAYARLPGVEVVGGYDPAVGTGAFPFPLFASAEAMLARTQPDILTVATPPAFHYELTRLGLRAGCHVFCEKPFVEHLDQARELVALARAVGRWVVVNNQYRFLRIHEEANKRIGSPAFGDLLFLRAEQTFRVSEQTEAGWRGRASRRTCQEFGTHILDLCRFFFGEDPLAITARMPRGDRPGGPDYLNLIQLEFGGDRMAHITLDRLTRGPHRYLSLRLDGRHGCIETSLGGRFEFHAGLRSGTRRPFLHADLSPGGWARLYHGERFQKIASEPLDVFACATGRLVQAFVDALATGTTPPCHAADNLRTLALMLAAYESEAKRTTIPLTY